MSTKQGLTRQEKIKATLICEKMKSNLYQLGDLVVENVHHEEDLEALADVGLAIDRLWNRFDSYPEVAANPSDSSWQIWP